MRKVIVRILSIVMILVALLCVYSLIRQESFVTLKIKFDGNENSAPVGRAVNVDYAVPLSHVAGYNYFLLSSQSLSTPERQASYKDSYLPVDSNFYRDNRVQFAEFEIEFSGLLDAKSMQLDQARLAKLNTFYKNFFIPDENGNSQPFRFSQVDFIAASYPADLSELTLNYAENSLRVKTAILNQLKIAVLMLSENGLPFADAVLTPGAVDRKQADLFGLLGAKNNAYDTVARNIFNGLTELEKAYPNNKIRVVLKNFSPWNKELYNKVESHGSLKKTEPLSVLGFDPADLRRIIDRVIALNAQAGNAIPNIEKKLAMAIDSSNLIDFIYYTNDLSGIRDQRLRYQEIMKLTNSYLEVQLPVISRRGEENLLPLIYLSFNNPLQIETNHYPFSRATFENTTDGKKAVLQQLDVLRSLYKLSKIGYHGENNIIVMAMPRRQLVSPLHYLAKPLAEAIHAYYKRDGADRWEQEYSLAIWKQYINIKK